ncbi:hypothetical protein BpHYR1_002566 [Brachionus plicatilis]|uniref:Uncharacterized protein n=1 Tax=Brachionus plicatilis TaxID=10195 RepID=A0A3M7RGP5_BRAPC|nr:hypothetical protein BpHYR1_002566 [Brachionus plicatilis]
MLQLVPVGSGYFGDIRLNDAVYVPVILAYALGTFDQFGYVRLAAGHKNSAVHLSGIKCPVAYSNYGHFLMRQRHIFARVRAILHPCMELSTMLFANDFELPGLPTINSGILNSKQTMIIKTFSNRA